MYYKGQGDNNSPFIDKPSALIVFDSFDSCQNTKNILANICK